MMIRRVSLLPGLLVITLVGCDRDADRPPPSAGAPGAIAASSEQRRGVAPLPPEQMPLPSELTPIFTLIQEDRTGPARVRLVKYQKLHAGDGQSVFLFGLTYHREKKYGQARGYFERAIELSPRYAPAYYFLGWASYYLGDLEAAEQAFDTYRKAVPDDADAVFAQGLIALDGGDLDAAGGRFNRSLSLAGTGPEAAEAQSKALTRLADVAEVRGDHDAARSHFEAAIDAMPDNEEALYKLSRLMREQGRVEEANRLLGRFLAIRGDSGV